MAAPEATKEDVKAFEETQKELETLGLRTPEPEVVEPAATIPKEPDAVAEPKAEPKVEEPKPEEVSKKEPPFDFKAYKAELRAELQADYEKKLEALKAEQSKEKPNETVSKGIEDDAKELAKKLGFDEDKTKAILETARKGLEPLSAEDKKLLEDYRADKAAREAKALEDEQNQIFETEFAGILPALQKEYPNASPEQIALAKARIDELSHSEKYHETDLDYVLFKEKEEIGKILFSPKKATFEAPRTAPVAESEDEWPEITADMTPNQMLAAEKKRQRMIDAMPKEKMRITTRDDMGRIVERDE
jgi:hypothetical protein